MSIGPVNLSGAGDVQEYGSQHRTIKKQSEKSDELSKFGTSSMVGAGYAALRNDSSFLDEAGEGAKRWSARRFTSSLLDDGLAHALKKANVMPETYTAVSKTKQMAKEASRKIGTPTNYQQLFKLGDKTVSITKTPIAKLPGAVAEAAKENVKTIANPFKGLSAGAFAKNTLVASNLRPIIDAVEEGKIFTAGASALALGSMVFDSVHEAGQELENSRNAGQSAPETAVRTGLRFAVAAAKNGFAWEASTVGFTLATALLPFSGPLGILIGIGAGALSAVGAKKVINTFIPPPKPTA